MEIRYHYFRIMGLILGLYYCIYAVIQHNGLYVIYALLLAIFANTCGILYNQEKEKKK